ncbi:MAG: TetR/AcrR family transcriptional regulator [Frankia sp.]
MARRTPDRTSHPGDSGGGRPRPDEVAGPTDAPTGGRSPGPATAHRRHGDALEEAIRQATLRVLANTGYARMTMDEVAHEARTSKPVLYRRWPGKRELVVDTILTVTARSLGDPPDTGTIRGDLVALLLQISALLRTQPWGLSIRLIAELNAEPELRDRLWGDSWGKRGQVARMLLSRAARRGEVRPEATDDLLTNLGSSYVLSCFIFEGRALDRLEIERLVDEVWLPALRPVPPTG